MEMTLTDNFYTLARTACFAANSGTSIGSWVQSISTVDNGGTNITILGTLKNISGNPINTVYKASNTNTWYSGSCFRSGIEGYDGNTGMTYSSFFRFGTGNDTPSARNNYKLDNENTTDISVSITGALFSSENNGGINFAVTATASSTVTIKEIGWFRAVKPSSAQSSWDSVLAGRLILDEPVTLTNGQSKTFDITISLPIPA